MVQAWTIAWLLVLAPFWPVEVFVPRTQHVRKGGDDDA